MRHQSIWQPAVIVDLEKMGMGWLTWNDDNHGDEVNDEDGVVVFLLQQKGRQRDRYLHGLLAVGVTELSPVVHSLLAKDHRRHIGDKSRVLLSLPRCPMPTLLIS